MDIIVNNTTTPDQKPQPFAHFSYDVAVKILVEVDEKGAITGINCEMALMPPERLEKDWIGPDGIPTLDGADAMKGALAKALCNAIALDRSRGGKPYLQQFLSVVDGMRKMLGINQKYRAKKLVK